MPLKKRDINDFCDPTKPDFWPELVEVYDRPYVRGVVIYEVQDMCSSSLGERKAVAYAFKHAQDHPLTRYSARAVVKKYPTLDSHLASTIKWPVAYCEKEPTNDNAQQTVERHSSRDEAGAGRLPG